MRQKFQRFLRLCPRTYLLVHAVARGQHFGMESFSRDYLWKFMFLKRHKAAENVSIRIRF